MIASAAPRLTGVWVFLLLSFGGTWGCLVGARLGLGWSLQNPLVQLMPAFIPAVGAVVVRRWVTREGFADAGLRPRFRAAGRWYLLSLGVPLLVVVAAVALAALLGYEVSPAAPVLGLPPAAFVLVMLVVVPLLTPVYWGEEFGWTGYLRPRLFAGRPLPAAIVTGLIWGVWHYPLAFLGYVDYANVAVGLLTWTLICVTGQVVLTWLRLHSGSIWTASLWHAEANMVVMLLVSNIVTSGGEPVDPAVVDLLVAVPMAVLCVAIVAGGGLRPAGGSPVPLPDGQSDDGRVAGGRHPLGLHHGDPALPRSDAQRPAR